MKQTLEFGSYSQAGRRQGLENFSGIGRGGLVCYVRRTILDEEGSWILNAWATSSILPFGREKSAIREKRSPRPSCRNKSERMRDKACMQIGGRARCEEGGYRRYQFYSALEIDEVGRAEWKIFRD